jgi:ABC-type Mn2+/Zn2+ transport system permease subunit
VLELLGQSFFQNALLGGTVIGLTCSFVGVYMLLRRVVFLGIALAQLASAGVALALLLGWNPLLTALAVSLGGAVAFSQIRWRGLAPVEAVLGASYVLAAALGTVFIARNPVGEARALSALFGHILAVPAPELAALAIVAIGILLVHLQFRKEFVFVSFDYETAAAHGVKARLWDLLLYLTLGVAIAFAIRSAGVLVTFALLVVPALGARLLVRSLGAMFAVATGLGTLSVPIGLGAAFALDLPTGATVSLTIAVLFGTILALRALTRMMTRSLTVALVGALLLGVASPAAAQSPGAGVHRELRDLRQTVDELRRIVEEQQRVIDQLRAGSHDSSARPGPVMQTAPTAPPGTPAVQVPPAAPHTQVPPGAPPPTPPPSPPPPLRRPVPTAEAPAPAESRGLPPWLALLPELRLEGNFIGNFTINQSQRRTLERQLGEEREDADFFVRRDRINVREIELGLRSAVDPFARFEAIISAEQEFDGDLTVGLEEAILSFGALPGGVQGRIGKFRTGFGEFNDSDPEEFPEVDPPNVISNVFGRDGDGWIDTGIAVTRIFGITDRFTLQPTVAVFNGDNDEAFHGGGAGVARRPAWYGRLEGFFELADAAGIEVGVGYAQGRTLDEAGRARLHSRILNAHLELDYRDPVLGLYRGINFLTEVFYTLREQEETDEETGQSRRETAGRWGLYALAETQVARRWSVGGRFDYSQLPERREDGPRVAHETAGSLIVSFRPSRFLTLRAQYKHTERNFALSSDEVFLQALFKIGYERPGPF